MIEGYLKALQDMGTGLGLGQLKAGAAYNNLLAMFHKMAEEVF